MERSLFIVKPDAVRRNLIGRILTFVEEAGIEVIAMKMVHLTEDQARGFYKVHEGKDFLDQLAEYMSSGKCVVTVLESDGVIERVRSICGKTDPADAAEGTIRATFGVNLTMNSVHASDSSASANYEIGFFFPDMV